MSQPAKAQEPSMEEILASIRRIIADDDSGKPAAKPAAVATPAPPPPPAAVAPAPQPVTPPPAEPPAKSSQHEVDAMLASLNAESIVAAPKEEEAVPTEEAAAPKEDDVLELTESMAAPVSEPVSPSFQTIDGQSDVVFADLAATPEPAPRIPVEARQEPAAPPAIAPAAPPAPPSNPAPQLLSNTTAAAVDSAFNALAQTVLVQNARTLEDLVREMLRPLLKSWLDDNLPGIVERTVRAEIERVSRGRT